MSLSPHPIDREKKLRRDLLRLVLRDTLTSSGIPAGWLAAVIVHTQQQDGTMAFQIRMLVHCVEPELLQQLCAIQQHAEQRLLEIEPNARQWFAGFLWKLSPPSAQPPAALPGPSYWSKLVKAMRARDIAAGRVKPTREELEQELERTRAELGARDFEATEPFDPSQPAPLGLN